MRKVIFFDKDKCISCYSCVIACKVKNDSAPIPVCPPEADPYGPDRINIFQYGPFMDGDRVNQFFQPASCRHCADAPCIKNCPESAIYKDTQFNITLVDRTRCIGCQTCLQVCPFGAPAFDEMGKLTLCNMCIDRLKQELKTACEVACPAGAIKTGTDKEISIMQGRKVIEKMGKAQIW